MILGTSRVVRVFAFPAPVDLRKGYDGLYGLVQGGLKRDPLSGELFLFVNQTRKLCKVLLWDGTGLCIFQKRLERGTFAKLWRDDDQVVRLTASELALFVEGCALVGKYTLSPIAIERKRLVSDRAV
ncbi:MAG TPA: IS66 family insertion sequence element accessory protein TnpB [Burkholderiales bacterium]|nr:IS66 family insertion sequence element accessory protein TnpB [Burkholderiales bacterium]